MRKRITRVLLAGAFATALALAQNPGRPNPGNGNNGNGERQGPPDPATMIQRRVDRLAVLLSLTDAQKTQATTIFTNAASSATTILANLRTQHQMLQTAIQHNDVTTINQVAKTIGDLTAQLTAGASIAEALFYQSLTPDQQTKLNQLGPRGRMGFGPPGPGGFGPPPEHGPRGR